MKNESGMVAPIHMGLGAIIGLVCVFSHANALACVLAILLAIYTHAWIDAYNGHIDHFIEDNTLTDRVAYWFIVAVGTALCVLVVIKYTYFMVIACMLAAALPDADHALRYIPNYPYPLLHRLTTHPALIDNGSNVARAICVALVFGTILL